MNAPIETPLHARAWQRMLSGRRLDLIDPSPFDIEISDIAHGLARLARWNGQTKGPHAFTVAQHCILVEDIASALKPNLDAKFRLAALLHDAPEYVVGDLISPFKAVMGASYKSFELRIQSAIHIRFGLPPVLPPGVAQTIKKADKTRRLLRGDPTGRLFCHRRQGLFRRSLRFVHRASGKCRAAGADGDLGRGGCVSAALRGA